MKKHFSIFALFIVYMLLHTADTATAANYEYTLLEPLTEDATGGFANYIGAVYNFAIWTVGVAALLMLSIGGFMYMTSAGNNANAEAAKRVIKDALLGLIVALLGWIILTTINPDILRGNLSSITNLEVQPPSNSTGGNGSGGGGGGGAQPPIPDNLSVDDKIAIELLNATDVQVVSSGDCFNQSVSTCTSVTGLPTSAVTDLVALSNDCDCGTIHMTGGTETGHATHAPGESIVDLGTNNTDLNTYITDNSTGPTQVTTLGPKYTITEGPLAGATFLRESSPNHWHVVLP